MQGKSRKNNNSNLKKDRLEFIFNKSIEVME